MFMKYGETTTHLIMIGRKWHKIPGWRHSKETPPKMTKKSKKPSEPTDVAALVQQLMLHDAGDASVDRIAQLSTALEALKQGSGANADDRDICATAALHVLDGLTARIQELSSEKDTPSESREEKQRDALEASRAVFLLNKYQRQLPERSSTKLSEPIETLNARVATGVDWAAFVLRTARVLIACERAPQASELLELLEKRLLKLSPRPPYFRSLVQMLAATRQQARLEPPQGATPEAVKAFEWYLTDPGIGDDKTLVQLDQLIDRSWFFSLTCIEDLETPAMEKFARELLGQATDASVVFVGKQVVCGADNEDKLIDVLSLAMTKARQCGVHIDRKRSKMRTQRLELLGFEVAQKEIVRGACGCGGHGDHDH